VALALHDRAGIGRLQAEILLLPLRVLAVIADAVFHPVAHARHGQLREQERRLLEEMRQARAGEGGVVAVDGAGGAAHQIEGDIEIMLQLLQRMLPPRHRRQGLQEGRDGLAVGRLLHRLDGLHHRRQRFLAQRLHHRRPLLHEYQDRLDAAAQAADGAGSVEIGGDAVAAQHRQRFHHAVLEHLAHLRKAAVQLLPVGLHQRMFVCGFGHDCSKRLKTQRGGAEAQRTTEETTMH